jgi:hypothetical protein
MPEHDDFSEEINEVSPYAQGFQEWLMGFTDELGREGPDVVDLAIIMMNCMAKMRGVMLAEELHAAVHNALGYMEDKLPDSGSVLAEHWRHLEDGYELYKATNTAEAPDDISSLVPDLPPDLLRD